MKKVLALVIALGFVSQLSMGQEYESFGKKISKKNAQDVATLTESSVDDGSKVKVKGEISAVCKMKGCWMKMVLADGTDMRVTFKDYGFFVPKDIVGAEVIMSGTPMVKVTPVDELQHYAKDAGKSQSEIDEITEPKRELTFVADGVLVPKGR